MNLDDISEVSMDYELFHEMLKWCINKEILSSSYNHGWKPFKNGQQILVNRDYTIKFCFQRSTISGRGNEKTFYKIVRGGRPLPKYGHGKNRGDEAIERLGRDTPSFEEMIYPAISREGANKRGNSSRLTQSFHFFMFEPIFSPVNALNQPI